MPARLDPETAPNTVVVVEDSFRHMLQRASGHGEALQIEVDHIALMEAAVDSGFTSDDVLSFAFITRADKPNITISADDETPLTRCIIEDPRSDLRTSEEAQSAIQRSIIHNLINLAYYAKGVSPHELIHRANPPLKERIKRQAKVIGGFAASVVGSTAVLETTASGSPDLLKAGSVILIGQMAYNELSKRVRPAKHKDENVIAGYRPFVNFKIDRPQT